MASAYSKRPRGSFRGTEREASRSDHTPCIVDCFARLRHSRRRRQPRRAPDETRPPTPRPSKTAGRPPAEPPPGTARPISAKETTFDEPQSPTRTRRPHIRSGRDTSPASPVPPDGARTDRQRHAHVSAPHEHRRQDAAPGKPSRTLLRLCPSAGAYTLRNRRHHTT